MDAAGCVVATASTDVAGCAIAAGGTGAGTAEVLSLLLNTVDFVPAFGDGTGFGAASGSACAACLSGARAASSDVAGNCCAPNVVELTTDGSSRSFTYKLPSIGCGTGMEYPGKPSGTCTGCTNFGSLETESTRNRLEPLNLHARSGVDGHFNS